MCARAYTHRLYAPHVFSRIKTLNLFGTEAMFKDCSQGQISIKDSTVVREYHASDFKDIMSAKYPFDITEFGSTYKDLKSKLFDALERSETRRLVLYRLKEKKAVGIVTLKKINTNLWGIGDIFVSPPYRRRGLSVRLYRASFSYLRQRGVKKAFVSVNVNNIPSRKSIKKIWDDFLPQKYYQCHGVISGSLKENRSEILIRHYRPIDKEALYQIYVQCVCENWRTFLEIDRSNFLGSQRIIPGVSFWSGLLKFLSGKQILIAERRNGNIEGYAVTRRYILPIAGIPARLYLFLSPKLSQEEAMVLFKKFANFFLLKGFREFYLFSINRNEKVLSDFSCALSENFGLRISQYLVCGKALCR